jgi:putative hydrolase of the HAD superfamily
METDKPRAAGTLSGVKAVLLDMDDTLIVYDAVCAPAWDAALREGLGGAGIDGDAFRPRFERIKEEYWEDPGRHRAGRLDLLGARSSTVLSALREFGRDGPALARSIAARYGELQTGLLHPLPATLSTLALLKEAGCALGLLTNGEDVSQNAKIDRFGLRPWFGAILVEGAFGAGKPDARVYREALRLLGVSAAETVMVGDNLAWDVAGAQACGIRGVWHNLYGKRNGPESGIVPDAIISDIGELPSLLGL